jgi:hypothetical protein
MEPSESVRLLGLTDGQIEQMSHAIMPAYDMAYRNEWLASLSIVHPSGVCVWCDALRWRKRKEKRGKQG